MFPSFTGSARPKRQVNLSGRNNNPFAALPGSPNTSASQSSQNAIAQAQHERILRQQERERPPAATRIQKTWRGYRSRREARNNWRQAWDEKEEWDLKRHLSQQGTLAYSSEADCLGQLRLLVQFVSPLDEHDIQRLHHFTSRYLQSGPIASSACAADVWIYPLLLLAKVSLATLSVKRTVPLPSNFVDDFLALLHSLANAIPIPLTSYSNEYFRTLGKICEGREGCRPGLIEQTASALLQPSNSKVETAYEAFVSELLTIPDLPEAIGSLELLARGITYGLLATALNNVLSPLRKDNVLQHQDRERLLWLLAYFIYFRRWISSIEQKRPTSPNSEYVKIVSRLISFLAEDIGTRIDASYSLPPFHSGITIPVDSPASPLPEFVRSEILTLINQENVSNLLANFYEGPALGRIGSPAPSEASVLASYALTLLRAFPRRGDDIRLWLYRGSTAMQSTQDSQSGIAIPAIKYFYQAASATEIYCLIRKDPRETVNVLRPDKPQAPRSRPLDSTITESRDPQWRVILLFLELYTFVLKVMDDEEFLSGTWESNDQWSWTRKSALPLEQVKDLTVFLKNLAFSLYWNASEIAGVEAVEAKTSLAEYFGGNRVARPEEVEDEASTKIEEMSVAGVSGMTLLYMKGLVTGVLRMVYERE